ncbi:methylglyoxal/glyoxal reductase [Spiroplasma sp. TIUS-1]|uniref:aldo/keto reductase n=1 Tax=Spiroplasma sp. TIUS-1 TaxID=216963 RepID=UPI001397980D|nr:aldo/keto reductase [Spiroplasma sp. TIUS-1]QHX35740.1 methylglyoxal/glyoxal reductase [Spiroplasma sp. TIUS-1]
MSEAKSLKIKLHNGIMMPQVGFGTYRIQDQAIGVKAIAHAINSGYELLDTADIYRNHHIVREGIKQSNKNRNELFITTKLWPVSKDIKIYKDDFGVFLKQLDTDYIDLLIVHWPLPFGKVAYEAAEQLYKEGKVRAIGVSNYNKKQLEELISSVEIKPMVNQIELNPNAIRQDVVDFAKANDIAITSWQTMMEGKVSELEHFVKLSQKYKVDSPAIALKWAIQKGIAIIPKSVTPSRIETNLNDLALFKLTEEEIEMIDNLSTEKGMNVDSNNYISPTPATERVF